MYHCHINFYYIGHICQTFEIIKEIPPLEHFTHSFSQSDRLEASLASQADVILADLQGVDAGEALREILSAKGKDAEVILLIGEGQFPLLAWGLSEVQEIWKMPMGGEEIRFHFLRWQQGNKMAKDFWETSHFFESTINHIPSLIWYKDKNGIHEKVNDSFCKTVNKTKQQVEGRGHAYIWDVEHDDPACIESENEVMSKEKTCISEETIQTGEGQRLLTTYKSPLYDLDGSVMGTVGVAIDITKERAYEKEIIEKNRTLEAIFASIDCGVICHSLDGSQIYSINRAALEILGYESQEEMIGDGFFLVSSSVVDEDKPKVRESIHMLEEKGGTVSVEYRIRHKTGDVRHVIGTFKLVEENGKQFYQRFFFDFTDQRRQEKKEREENEKRQMELLHALSIDYNLVCYFDLDTGIGNPLRGDADSGRMFGSAFNEKISYTESFEQYVREAVYKEDQEMLLQAFSRESLKQELEEKVTYYKNYRVCTEEEMEYYQMKAVRTGEWGKNHGIVLGYRSVDKEIRDEMEKKNMLEDALMQANRASKAKSLFLSNMSHDIRTPMNAIVGFTALAITHINQKEHVEEYLEKIMSSGNHLLSLINDVLDMSRIESGKIHLDEKLCSLPDILHGLRNILLADIHAKQLELYIDTVDVLDEEIYCDKLRLNQVLLNLLSNAVKYTGAGGIISMRITEKAGAPKGYANYEFFIKDTGIGMSQEFVEHIFEPFEREKTSTISGIQGTGLGMAITKNIVDMMNGTITVKSEQGVGSEFLVSFTFRLHAEAKEISEIPELKNARALVVDDDFNTCDSVSYMLQQIGMRAEWTMSGKEALLRTHQAHMREDDYAVYIVDWLLPDMNGVEVARRIRKEMGENVPIIVITAYDWSEIEEEAGEAGVTKICSKPLFLSELHSCLHSIVNAEAERKKGKEQRNKKIRSGRILLAEDNELNQEIAVAILGDAGFTTEVAENGKIAIDMIQEAKPGYYQLVLMDVQMPEMNGYEATKVIRSLDDRERAAIPILAMTANAFDEDRQEALKCGMNGHIAKPIDVKKLFETLDKVLLD